MAPNHTVRLVARHCHERIDLVDAKLNYVPLRGGLWMAEASVVPGVYVARFSTSEAVSEHAFIVREQSDEPMLVHGPRTGTARVDSAAPIAASRAVPEDLAVARELSVSVPVDRSRNQPSGSLFLLMRKREICDGSEAMEANISSDVSESVCDFVSQPWADIALHDADGHRVVELGDIARQTNVLGCTCVHVRLPAGLYFLRFQFARRSMDQCVYVAQGYQTQAFLRKRHAISRTGKPAADLISRESWVTAKMSVHMAPEEKGFDPDADAAAMHEELLNMLAAGRPVATLPELSAKLNAEASPFLNLLFWLTQAVPRDGESALLSPAEARRLASRLAGFPDAELLWHAASMNRAAEDDPDAPDVGAATSSDLRAPPMLVRAWNFALRAENRKRLWIPGDSIVAQRAHDSLAVGPWFRTLAAEPGTTRGVGECEQYEGLSEGERLGLDGEHFKRFLTDLGSRLRNDAKTRIQLASTQFSFPEKRLLSLLLPESDTTIFQIVEAMPKRKPPDSKVNEDSLVEALCMPRSSLYQLIFSAFKKLFHQPILPDAGMLRRFIDEECSNHGILRDALEKLLARKTTITHAVENYALNELELLFLYYERSLSTDLTKPRGLAKLVDILSGLDFMALSDSPKAPKPTQKLQSSDLSAAIGNIREFLSTPIFPSDETGLAIPDPRDRVQIELTSVRSYRRSHLLTVKRSRGSKPHGKSRRMTASPRDVHAHSYSEDMQLQDGTRAHSFGKARNSGITGGAEADWTDDRSMRNNYRSTVEASVSTLHGELNKLLELQ